MKIRKQLTTDNGQLITDIMKYLVFILWMILYPISISIENYLGTKRRKIEGKEPYSNEANAFGALVNLIIWAYIGKVLFNYA